MIRKYNDSCSPRRCGSASTRDEHSDSRRQSCRLVLSDSCSSLVFVARCGSASTRSEHSDNLRPSISQFHS